MADSQTSTILVTDLVGSTELRVRLGEERADALRRIHDELLHVAVTAEGGVVVKGLGDGLLAMFASASDAVGAAVRIQQGAYAHNRSRPDEALDIRVGLSAGDVSVEEGDCFGTPVVEASRLCAAAVGGQILAAELVRMLARGRGGHVFTASGERELRGLPEPVPVMVVGWDPPDPDAAGVPFPVRLTPQALAPLSGRDAQLQILLDAWKESAAGARRVVLVSGEPGIGKTRLAAEAARHAHDAGGVVVFGRCDEDLGVPFQPFVEALEQVVRAGPSVRSLGRHAGELVRLVPELAQAVHDLEPPLRSDPETERYRMMDAVVAWLGALSEPAGVVLVLDDLHWAEKPTLLLLRHLVRSAEPMRLLMIGTYRDTDLDRTHPLGEVLADLRREPSVQRLALTGLDVDGVAELLARLSGERDDGRGPALAQALWSETEGNPFFIGEILVNLVESGRLVQRDGVWTSDEEIGELGIPEGIREVIGKRLNRLSDTTNTVLQIASVMGATFDVDVLVSVSDPGEDAVLDALDEATAAALLREIPSGGFEFTHALVRSTLYDELSAARRARRHRQIGEALEARGADPAALAYHFGRSGAPDARTSQYAFAAGERAVEKLAYDQAVAFFTQAIETADDLDMDDDRRCRILIGLGSAQRLAGLPASRDTLLHAARLAQGLGDGDLLARAALANNRGAWSEAGSFDAERVQILEAALDAAGPADSPTRARLMATLAVELVFGDPGVRRFALAEEALAMALRLGDDRCLVEVWVRRLSTFWDAEHVPALAAEMPALLELAEAVGDDAELALAYGYGVTFNLEIGDFDEADSLLERMELVAVGTNNPLIVWLTASRRGAVVAAHATGDELEHFATVALQAGQDAGQPDAFTAFAGQLATARELQGRLTEIIDLLRQQVSDNPGLPAWRAALAYNLARIGEHDEAAHLVDDLMGSGDDPFPFDLLWLDAHCRLGDAVTRVGTPAQAARQYDVLAPYAGRHPCIGMLVGPSVSLRLATLAARSGRLEKAEEYFREAAVQHERLRAPIWLAETNLRWGQFLLDDGDTVRARALLIRARDTATTMGAVDIASIASALLGDAPDHRS